MAVEPDDRYLEAVSAMVDLVKHSPQQLRLMRWEAERSAATEQELARLIYRLLTQAKSEALVAAAFDNFSANSEPVLRRLVENLVESAAQLHSGLTDWGDLSSKITDKIVNESAEVGSLIASRAAKEDSNTLDIYERGIGGDTGDVKWSEGAARILTTRVREMAKEDLASHLGLDYKRWQTAMDDRVRHSHAILEGEQLTADGLFNVGGALMSRPGDPSAPLAQRINCRCSLLWSKPSLNQ